MREEERGNGTDSVAKLFAQAAVILDYIGQMISWAGD